jgi:hypothetical protein
MRLPHLVTDELLAHLKTITQQRGASCELIVSENGTQLRIKTREKLPLDVVLHDTLEKQYDMQLQYHV